MASLILVFIAFIILSKAMVRRGARAQTQAGRLNRFKAHLLTLPEQQRRQFLDRLPERQRTELNAFLHSASSGDQQHWLPQSTAWVQQFNDWALAENQRALELGMHESLKGVTPFDHGGYVQGPGFNPSDTLAHDMQQHQMHQQMNHHDPTPPMHHPFG